MAIQEARAVRGPNRVIVPLLQYLVASIIALLVLTLPYDSIKDCERVATVQLSDYVLVGHRVLPVVTRNQLIMLV